MSRKILTLDCETDPFKKGRHPKPFTWGVFDGETFSQYPSFEPIHEMIKEENFIVYAHNAGKFDYHFVLDYVNPFEEIMVINSRIAKMKMGACEFRDSMNILPMSQEKLIGKYNIDYSILEHDQREKPVNKDEIRKRLSTDCRDLHTLVSSFTKNYGPHLTLAGAAFKQWRKISGQKSPVTNANFYANISPFYYGGRVQCFYMGEFKENFCIYDINSAYPNAMLKEHPYGTYFLSQKSLPSTNIEISFISLIAKSTGAFPYRSDDGALYFPNDGQLREFHITGYEFLKAEKLGLLKIEKVLKCLVFPEKINFAQYVKHFFKKKQFADEKGDQVLRNEAKLFLNGLYGKFASNPAHYHEYMLIDPKFLDACEKEHGYFFNSMLGKWALVRKPLAPEKCHYYNVATAASITGAQRAEMMEAIQNVDTPLYCDTDSIACRSPRNLNIGTGLGEWKTEAHCTYAAIAGKKLYAFKKENGSYKTASKGVRLTATEIIRIARGETIEAENEAPTFSIKKDPYFMKRKIKMKKELQNI